MWKCKGSRPKIPDLFHLYTQLQNVHRPAVVRTVYRRPSDGALDQLDKIQYRHKPLNTRKRWFLSAIIDYIQNKPYNLDLYISYLKSM